jgi:hypothetical protein
MLALALDIEAHFTNADGTMKTDAPQTWDEVRDWMKAQCGFPESQRAIAMHQTGTWHAVYRRLWEILHEGRGVFPFGKATGNPLKVTKNTTSPPQVVDIHSLPASLQRFVVAAILKQVVKARSGKSAAPGLRYVIVLDELNRFAPKDGRDGITKLLKEIALERRSQGVILFGAQQFASQVATEIVESASIRVLGRTGPAELEDKIWKGWDANLRRQASDLKPEDKLVSQVTFRQPMLVKLPRPSWAMRAEQRGTLNKVNPRAI